MKANSFVDGVGGTYCMIVIIPQATSSWHLFKLGNKQTKQKIQNKASSQNVFTAPK